MDPKWFEMVQNAKLALQMAKDNWEIFEETARLKAKAKRTFYEECLRAGFRPDEALMLTMHHDPFGSK